MAEDDPRKVSDALERQIDEMEHEGREVRRGVNQVREEWERKRRDENVPGALPPEGGETEDPGPPDAA